MRSRFMFAAAVLTLAVLVGWAVNTVTSEVTTVQRNAGDITLVECETGSRANVSRASFSMGRVVCGLLPTAIATATGTPTAPLPTPTTTAITITNTATATPSSSSTPPAAPTPTPTATVAGTDACTGNPDCGVTDFCSTWSGGWCEDYDEIGSIVFELPYLPTNATVGCLDATDPGYEPHMMNGALPFPCWFAKYRHVMSRMESGSFGVAMVRYHRPVNIPATGERHIRFDADMKGRTRNYFRLMLSPDITKRDSDDRNGQAYPRSFIQAWFRNGNIEGTICRNSVCEGDSYPFGDAFGLYRSWEPVFSPDNVRVPIDVYVSQTSIRIYINGTLKTTDTFAPLGFDTAFLYLSQASYNPVKDGQSSVADQIVHWDQVAVDGPTLPLNGLTPRGYRDYAWNTYAAASCSIGGYPAIAQTSGPIQGYTWTTFVARVPESVTLTRANVSCAPGAGYSFAGEQHRDFEVVVPE